MKFPPDLERERQVTIPAVDSWSQIFTSFWCFIHLFVPFQIKAIIIIHMFKRQCHFFFFYIVRLLLNKLVLFYTLYNLLKNYLPWVLNSSLISQLKERSSWNDCCLQWIRHHSGIFLTCLIWSVSRWSVIFLFEWQSGKWICDLCPFWIWFFFLSFRCLWPHQKNGM